MLSSYSQRLSLIAVISMPASAMKKAPRYRTPEPRNGDAISKCTNNGGVQSGQPKKRRVQASLPLHPNSDRRRINILFRSRANRSPTWLRSATGWRNDRCSASPLSHRTHVKKMESIAMRSGNRCRFSIERSQPASAVFPTAGGYGIARCTISGFSSPSFWRVRNPIVTGSSNRRGPHEPGLK